MITALLIAATLTQPTLTGSWVTIHRSTGGLGTILTFLPDSKLDASYAAIVETWYRTEGDKIVQPSGSNAPDAKPVAVRFHVEGNTLEFDPEGGTPTRFTRVGNALKGAPPIVGAWRIDPQRVIEYTRDGLIKVRYAMNTKSGTYDAAAKTFTLPDRSGDFHFENGLLIFNGEPFIRADATKAELVRAGIDYGSKPADLEPTQPRSR
jgi:hypothetical protein